MPCHNCAHRDPVTCVYPPGPPKRRGPGKAPKKTRGSGESSRPRQQYRRARPRPPPDQSQMSISAGSPGPSGPSPTAIGIVGGGRPLTPGGPLAAGPRFPSQSPGASTSEMEAGSQTGSRRRLSGSSVEDPERKRSRIRELGGDGGP